jgi:hypothetical protein
MLEIGGIYYMVDLTAMDELLSIEESKGQKEGVEKEVKEIYDDKGELVGKDVTIRTYDRGKEINGPKYDMIRMFFEVVLTYNEELDNELGIDIALGKTSLPFKLAFNTLLEYGIIKEIE